MEIVLNNKTMGTKTNGNDLAFARASFYHPDGGYNVPQAGLTIRQYYAGMVLQGLLASGYNGTDNYVEQSVIITDLLIEQLNKSVEVSSILEDKPQNKFAGPEAGLSIKIKEALKGFSQEVEEELPYKGQVVWVRDTDESKWTITHFIEKKEDKYICSYRNDDNMSAAWDQITTKNPYEDVSEMENTDREPQIGDMCFFWDDIFIDKNAIVCGKLSKINTENNSFYAGSLTLSYKHCSLKNPLIK